MLEDLSDRVNRTIVLDMARLRSSCRRITCPPPCLTRTGRSGSTGIMSCHNSFPRTEARILSPT